MPSSLAFYTDQPVLAMGLAEVIKDAGDIRFLGPVGSLGQFSSADGLEKPDLFLIDWSETESISTIGYVRQALPKAKIIVWVSSVTVDIAHQFIQLGVRGIVRKNLGEGQLLHCLRCVANEEMWIERTLMDALLSLRRIMLSPRERQLLHLVSQGWSNKQIAYELSISEGTVKVYFSKLFKKVGVRDRFELALYGLRQGQGEVAAVGKMNQKEMGFNTVAVGARLA